MCDHGTQLPLILVTPIDFNVSFVANSLAIQKIQGLVGIIWV